MAGGHQSAGRRRGARNRLSTDLLESLAEDFSQFGKSVIATARIERPIDYLKIVASTLPREFEITDSRLKELTDEELDGLIAELKRSIANRSVIEDAERGENAAVH
jgi:hypothetical protein